MKVLVRDDTLNPQVIVIGRGVRRWLSTYLVLKTFKPLVFHRPHVEVVDRHDHVQVEVVLQAVHLFVPAHRFLQRHATHDHICHDCGAR